MSFSQSINWSPDEYAKTAVLARIVGEEMLQRMQWMTLQPRVILDVGCGTGESSLLLQQHYPNANVFALDINASMSEHTQLHTGLTSLCANAQQLPFKDNSVDIVFANFLLPWHPYVKKLFPEWRRVLRPEGLLMLTALGPDTMQEWRQTFLQNDTVPVIDMHDLGDLLAQDKFADPVLDVDYYTLTYREKTCLIAELKASGMLANHVPSEEIIMPEKNAEQCWSVTFEVTFAHAWAPKASTSYSADETGVVKIPLSSLTRA